MQASVSRKFRVRCFNFTKSYDQKGTKLYVYSLPNITKHKTQNTIKIKTNRIAARLSQPTEPRNRATYQRHKTPSEKKSASVCRDVKKSIIKKKTIDRYSIKIVFFNDYEVSRQHRYSFHSPGFTHISLCLCPLLITFCH